MSNILTPQVITAFNDEGNIVPGAFLYAYNTGTTDLADIWIDPDLSTRAPNPLQANVAGRFPIFYADDRLYDLQVWTKDKAEADSERLLPDPVAAGTGGKGGDDTSSSYASIADFKTDTTTEIVNVGGLPYTPAPDDATDAHITTDSGKRYYSVPSGGETYIARAFEDDAQKMIDYMVANKISGKRAVFTEGSYTMRSGLILPSGNDWKFDNAEFDFSGIANADLSTVNFDTSGAGTASHAHILAQGDTSAMPSMIVNLSAGQTVLTFNEDHGLKSGDVFQALNRIDGSWSSVEPYYRKGQLLRVADVVDARTIWATHPIDFAQTAAQLDFLKYNAWTGTITGRGLNIKGVADTQALNYGLLVDFFKDTKIEGVRAEDVSYQTVAMSRGFEGSLISSGGAEDGVAQFGGDYSIGLYSCSHIKADQCSGTAVRHAITHGVTDGAPPYSHIHISRSSAGTVPNTGQNFPLDYHPGGHDCSTTKCIMSAGLNVGCWNYTSTDDIMHTFPGEAYAVSVSRGTPGGRLRFLGTHVRQETNPAIRSRGVFQAGVSDNYFDSLRDHLYVNIVDPMIDGQYGAFNVATVNSSNPVYSVSASIEGLDDNDKQRTHGIYCAPNPGAAPAKYIQNIDVKQFHGSGFLVAFANGYEEPTQYRAAPVSGVVTMQSGTGFSASKAVSFKWRFPVEPSVVVTVNAPSTTNGGNEVVEARAINVTTDGFTVFINLSDYNTSFGADVPVTVSWQARCEK